MSQVPDERLRTPNTEYLDWIQLNRDMEDSTPVSEPLKIKMIRRMKENPLVPLGMLATCGALGFGLRAMSRGNRQQSQTMMRFRILAQGLTIVAMLSGIVIANANQVKNKDASASLQKDT